MSTELSNTLNVKKSVETETCSICAEPYNKTFRHKVTCICEQSCCRDCVKKYINSKSENLHCLFCKTNWNREFVTKNFEKKYVTGDYKNHRENILFEAEIGLLPATQPHVEKELKIEKMNKEIDELRNQMTVINKEINKKSAAIRDIIDSKTQERKKYLRKCPNNTCQGFLSSQLKCELCNSWTCSECREIKGQSKDSPHTCNPDILESLKFLENDTKPCPKCTSMIHKIEGCAQMFCTECHTAFNWNTLRIETGIIHNPHYFEWQRRTSGNIERNPNEVLCGRELDHNFQNVIRRKYIAQFNEQSMTKLQLREELFSILRNNESVFASNSIIDDIKKSTMLSASVVCATTGLYDFSKSVHTYMDSRFKRQKVLLCDETKRLIESLPYSILNQRLTTIDSIIQKTIHIREVELLRWTSIDRVQTNLQLRISYMRNKIDKDAFRRELQKKDKMIERNNEYANILRMYVSCITDLLYRLYENINDYDNIIMEMHQLRHYTNDCIKRVFIVYGSTMDHYIDGECRYIIRSSITASYHVHVPKNTEPLYFK